MGIKIDLAREDPFKLLRIALVQNLFVDRLNVTEAPHRRPFCAWSPAGRHCRRTLRRPR
jgi:hypothetical protein